jgi:hypothetical protein
MIVQPELRLKTRTPSADRAAEDAAALVSALRSLPALQRMPAAKVGEYLDWNDRRLRAAAEASGGAILSAPGCVGYRLAEAVSVDDYNATERCRYRCQIRVMVRRLVAMDRAVHGARRAG